VSENGVTEIVVHGVGGSTPAAMLDDTTVRQITGDPTAGVVGGADGGHGREDALAPGGVLLGWAHFARVQHGAVAAVDAVLPDQPCRLDGSRRCRQERQAGPGARRSAKAGAG